jgi:histidine phosphotransferase ChpT
VTLNWALSADRLPKGAVKVLLNFAQMGLDALVRGGTLDIGAESRNGASEIVVRAAGPRIAFDQTIGRALENRLDPGELSSRTAAAHMLALLAKKAGGGLQFMLSDEALVLGAVLPEG